MPYILVLRNHIDLVFVEELVDIGALFDQMGSYRCILGILEGADDVEGEVLQQVGILNLSHT